MAAAARGESISAVVREALEDYVTATLEGDEDVAAALAAYERRRGEALTGG